MTAPSPTISGPDRAPRAQGPGLPAHHQPAIPPAPGHALRGEPPPAGGLLRGAGACGGIDCHRPATPGQGALLQQHRRHRRRPRVRQAVRRAAGLRHRQARQPLRRGPGARTCWRPTSGPTAPTRSPPSAGSSPSTASWTRRPPAPSSSASSSRSSSPPASRRGRLPAVAAKKNVRLLECGDWASAAGHRAGLQAGQRGPAGAGCAICGLTDDHAQVVTKRQPSAEEMLDLLFAWRVAKFVKSNAIVYAAGPHDHRGRRRPDEPGQLRAHRRHQGGAGGACGGGVGDGLRRLLPLPRRHRPGRRRRASRR